jgi:hypothetical protein
MSNNPWVDSRTDIALAPLKLFLNSFRLQNIDIESSSKEIFEEDYEKTLIDYLREADKITELKRLERLNKKLNKFYKDRNNGLSSVEKDELDILLQNISKSFDLFQDEQFLQFYYEKFLKKNEIIDDEK